MSDSKGAKSCSVQIQGLKILWWCSFSTKKYFCLCLLLNPIVTNADSASNITCYLYFLHCRTLFFLDLIIIFFLIYLCACFLNTSCNLYLDLQRPSQCNFPHPHTCQIICFCLGNFLFSLLRRMMDILS